MEIIEEYTDPHEIEPAILNLSADKIKLLEKRGFFPTSSGLIDLKRYAEELSELTHEERMQRRLSRTAVLLADIIKEEYRHRPEIVLDGEIILTVKED